MIRDHFPMKSRDWIGTEAMHSLDSTGTESQRSRLPAVTEPALHRPPRPSNTFATELDDFKEVVDVELLSLRSATARRRRKNQQRSVSNSLSHDDALTRSLSHKDSRKTTSKRHSTDRSDEQM